jgi:hypothetical protein
MAKGDILRLLFCRWATGMAPQGYINAYELTMQAAGQISRALLGHLASNKRECVLFTLKPFPREAFAVVLEAGHAVARLGMLLSRSMAVLLAV